MLKTKRINSDDFLRNIARMLFELAVRLTNENQKIDPHILSLFFFRLFIFKIFFLAISTNIRSSFIQILYDNMHEKNFLNRITCSGIFRGP